MVVLGQEANTMIERLKQLLGTNTNTIINLITQTRILTRIVEKIASKISQDLELYHSCYCGLNESKPHSITSIVFAFWNLRTIKIPKPSYQQEWCTMVLHHNDGYKTHKPKADRQTGPSYKIFCSNLLEYQKRCILKSKKGMISILSVPKRKKKFCIKCDWLAIPCPFIKVSRDCSMLH